MEKPISSRLSFYKDALNKIQENNVITPYARDRLLTLMTSEKEKEFNRFKKHFADLLALHDTIEKETDGTGGAPARTTRARKTGAQ